MRLWPALLLALAGAAGATAAADGAWQVEVPRPGLVRVPWPAEARADGGLDVRGPAGEEVAWRLVSLAAGERRSARVANVRAISGGWSLTVDAGVAPPRHQGLRLPLAEAGAASFEVEASDDGGAWRPLATATLFRLGGGAALQHSAVEYPATDARYLRLRWPVEAGFPKLADVELEVVASRDHRLEVAAACSEVGPQHARCQIAPAGRPLRALELVISDAEVAGWRLQRARGGVWEPLGEGTWSAAAGVPSRRLALEGADAPLLLDLWGESTTPRLAALALLAEPLALELEAAAAGTYRIFSTDGPAAAIQLARTSEAQWLPPVPTHDRPAPAASPPPQGAALPDAPFALSWPVTAEAAAGEAVRLELPTEVLEAARPGLDDLRLAAADRQVPYVLATAEAPARVAAWPALAAAAKRDGGTLFEVPLADAEARGATLVLRVASHPLSRPLRLRRSGDTPRGVAAMPSVPGPWILWECRPLPPLPCELALEVPVGRGPLEVEVSNGDDAPLAGLAAELWQPRRELLFYWPAVPVTLLAGSPGLAAARYELAAVDGRAHARGARTAALGAAGEGPGGALQRWPRWAPLGALAAAAAMLLFVLVRAVKAPAGER